MLPEHFPAGVKLILRCTPLTMEDQTLIAKIEDPALKMMAGTVDLWMPSLDCVKDGISTKHRRRHMYMLVDVAVTLRSKELKLDPTEPLVPALLRCLDYMRVVRGWKAASTIAGYAATLYGALMRLDQYSNRDVGIHLKERKYGSMWEDAMKSFTARALTYNPKVFATHPDIAHRLLSTLQGETLILCAIDWLHAARNKNASELLVDNITFLGENQWKIEWSHAKTSARIGTYYTFSAIGQDLQVKMEEFMEQRKKDDPGDHVPLIPMHKRAAATANLSRALKAQDPKLTLHTLRRGALSAMAKDGTDLETLMVFSGHSSVPTLLRYIQRGAHFTSRREKGAAAAISALLPKNGTTTSPSNVTAASAATSSSL